MSQLDFSSHPKSDCDRRIDVSAADASGHQNGYSEAKAVGPSNLDLIDWWIEIVYNRKICFNLKKQNSTFFKNAQNFLIFAEIKEKIAKLPKK